MTIVKNKAGKGTTKKANNASKKLKKINLKIYSSQLKLPRQIYDLSHEI